MDAIDAAVNAAPAVAPALVSPDQPAVPLAVPGAQKETPLPPVEAAFSQPVENIAATDPSPEEAPVAPPRREKAPSHAFGVIMGTIGGALLGVFAGMMLLVYSFQEPALSQLGDPLGLWQSVGDPLVKTSALLVAAGLMLLGLGVGSWARR